ncbi:hypothetical protein MMC08_000447 [Hypocenomyce scalaris]|nr:hypothetical protein [Hypocenomyce scalaris]
MAPTAHYRFKMPLCGQIPSRAPRQKLHRRVIAPTRASRRALQRLWWRLPLKITHESSIRDPSYHGEELQKTMENVAGRGATYIRFLEKKIKSFRRWGVGGTEGPESMWGYCGL